MYLLPVCHFKSEDLEKYVGGRVTQTGTVTISIISVYYFALIGLNGSLKSASERSCTETLNGWELHSLWYESELAKHSHRICLSYRMLSKVRKRKHVEMCSENFTRNVWNFQISNCRVIVRWFWSTSVTSVQFASAFYGSCDSIGWSNWTTSG